MSLFAGLVAVGATVGQQGTMSFWERITPPEDISTNGHLIDSLFNLTTFLDVVAFILVCIGLFGFSYFYSEKRHPKGLYTHGNKKVHLMITGAIGLLVFVSIDLNIGHHSSRDFKDTFANFPKKEEEVVKVEVLAQQWFWTYRYPGKDDVFNTDDDILSQNQLVLPVNKKVVLQISSKDVIHSLFITNARIKVDAIPGRITRMWFELTKPGEYEIACAEMCGTFHYKMKSYLKVLSNEDYAKWQESAGTVALAENDLSNKDSFWGWQWEQ